MDDNNQHPTIYLVDDQPTNLNLMSIFLKNKGFNAITQQNSVKAIEEIKEINPDLILLDVVMPELDGFETCIRLKSCKETKHIPIIFVTSSQEFEDKIRGLKLGAIDFLIKPLQSKELLLKIDIHLKIKQLQDKLLQKNQKLSCEILKRKKAQLALRRSEDRLKIIINNNLNGMIVVNYDGVILYMNPEAEKILRKKQEDMLGEELGIPLELNKVQELEFRSSEGQIITTEIRAVPIIWQEKNAYLISLIDITEKKKMEDNLKVLFEASEQSPALIMITNIEGKIEYVNPKFESVTGYTKEEVIGENPRMFKSGHTTTIEYKQLWETITQGKEWQGEFHNRRKNGEFYWEKALISPIINSVGGITHFVAVKEDITLQKQQKILLEYQAKYDELTNIPNRNYAQEKIQQMIIQAQQTKTQFALMFIDLDHFKEVNDTFGHNYGDELLIKATQRMKSNIRHTDLIARLGGDEFLIAIPFVQQNRDILTISEKILNSLKQLFLLFNEVKVSISASIGVAFFPSDAHNLEQLIKNADIAMFVAKENGRHQVQFFEQKFFKEEQKKSIIVHRNNSLEKEFYEALEKEEFKIVYQPILNLNSNLLTGIEIFLRWQTKDSGLLYPSEFISKMENKGIIFTLEKWLLKSVFEQINKWEINQSIPVHFNLSPNQFRSCRIIRTLKQFINENQFTNNHNNLIIEVKEQMFLSDNLAVFEILETIKSLNIGISLDNFGQGISSLTNLSQFPFQSVKIDTSLTHNLTNSDQTVKMVTSIIKIAQVLNIKVIAQSIENEQQLNILKNLGCEYGQGNFFSKPLFVEDFENYLIQMGKKNQIKCISPFSFQAS